MAFVAPRDSGGHVSVILSTGFSAGLKKLSYYFIIQEVITQVTDTLSCQRCIGIILSLRVSTLILLSS